MAKEGGYTIENVYQGGASTLDPNKSYSGDFLGYRTNAGSFGITTDPRTANQVKDTSLKLSSGVKQIELALVSPELFDSMPKQQLREIKQLSDLTGIDVSVHGPVIDTTGISQNGFSESSREAIERRITDVIERSREVKPDGSVPIVFHSAEGIQGSEWQTLGSVDRKTPREARRLIVVDRETGRTTALEKDTKYYPGGEEGGIRKDEMTPEDNLRIVNHTQWDNEITQIEFQRENAERIMKDIHPIFHDMYSKMNESRLTGKPFEYEMSPEEREKMKQIYSADEYLGEAEKKARSEFSKAYEIAKKDNDEGAQALLTNLSQNYSKILGIQKDGRMTVQSLDPKIRSEGLFVLSQGLKQLNPRMFVPIEEFAVEQSSKTFGNAAFNAFKKFGDVNKTPTIVIENPPAGFGLSTGEDLRNLVEASRNQFIKKAKEEGLSEKEAKGASEKLIGATWDVGHINMLKKQGFTDEDILKETEKIAPYLKHVHLSDNFGFEHTELPMGMGNVPMKEIMKKLGQKGFEAKKVIEAGQWWQHFQTNPVRETMEAFGSPIYSDGAGPYWNQNLGLQQGYFSGYGTMLPQVNYQTFGAGFSQLPRELGGDMSAGGGRFNQRGME